MRRRGRLLERLEDRHLLAAIPFDTFLLSQQPVVSTDIAVDADFGKLVIAEDNQLRGYELAEGPELVPTSNIRGKRPVPNCCRTRPRHSTYVHKRRGNRCASGRQW